MFKAGDYVVKANAGICVIEGIEKKKITEYSEEKEYYVLIPLEDKNSRLFVSTSLADLSLRMAMDEEDAKKFIRSIPDISEYWIESDKVREKRYKEAIKSNDPKALVGIIKSLYHRSNKRIGQGKKVTVIDDRYFKLAENTLYSELSHALGEKRDKMREIIADVIGSL